MNSNDAIMKTEENLTPIEDVRENNQSEWYLDRKVKAERFEIISPTQVSFPLKGTLMPTEDGPVRRAKVSTPAVLSDRGMWVSKEWCERVWDPLNSGMKDGQHVRVLTNGSNDVKCPHGVVIIVEGQAPMTIDVRDEVIEAMKRKHNDVIEHSPKGWISSLFIKAAEPAKEGQFGQRAQVQSRNQYHRLLHGGLRSGHISPGPVSLHYLSNAIAENCTTVLAVYRNSLRVATLLEAVRKAIFSQIYALTRPVSEALLSAYTVQTLWTVVSLERNSVNDASVSTNLVGARVVTLPHDYVEVHHEREHYVAVLENLRERVPAEHQQGLPMMVDVRGFMIGGYDGLNTAVAARDDDVQKFPFVPTDDGPTMGSVIQSRRLLKITNIDLDATQPVEWTSCTELDQYPIDAISPSATKAIIDSRKYLLEATDYFVEGGNLCLAVWGAMKPLALGNKEGRDFGHLVREHCDEDGEFPRMGCLAMSRFLIGQGAHKGGIYFTIHKFVDGDLREGRRNDCLLEASENLYGIKPDRTLALLHRIDAFLWDMVFHRTNPVWAYDCASLIDLMKAGQYFSVGTTQDFEMKYNRVLMLNDSVGEEGFSQDGYPEYCSCGSRMVITREDGIACASRCDSFEQEEE